MSDPIAAAPVVPAPLTTNYNRLHEEIAWVARAMSSDRTREALFQIAFDDGKLIATDGYRLHMQTTQVEFPGSIPGSAVDALATFRLALDHSNPPVVLRRDSIELSLGRDLPAIFFRWCSVADFTPYRGAIPAEPNETDMTKPKKAWKTLETKTTTAGVEVVKIFEGWYNVEFVTDALAGAKATTPVTVSGQGSDMDAIRIDYESPAGNHRTAVIMPLRAEF